ncbi:MAG TPA: FecR domain-containing protein [Candidatus Acidoferrales bacterium]|jgi:hypothetical protein|nr:FecR domain-containing protein [Candidatus Acidoferrales bacterium]
MNEDYLWDRSGPPDPEIERLERTLAPLRYRHRAEFVQQAPLSPRMPPRMSPRVWWAAAAAVVLAASGISRFAAPQPRPTAWQVTNVEGGARLGGKSAALDMQVQSGEAVRTGAGSLVSLQADDVGRMDIGPDSELRAATDRKVMLQRGTLHAYIWARPGDFVVDTPGARAIDLGCEYTLKVDTNGNGLIQVSLGWVAFQYGDHESFIPAGAQCLTHKSGGPGIPFYDDASDEFRVALRGFERGDTAALPRILAAARPRDGLTLWHLLTRAPAAERGRVFDRFGQLVSLSAEISRDAVVRRDAHAIDLCWDALGLENASWWRGWERRWSE